MPTSGIRVPDATRQLEAGPHTLAAKQGHAVEIARVCQTWALIESDVMFCYALLMGVDLPLRKPDEPIPRIHEVAFQVFETLAATANRTELLQRLASWKATSAECERIEKLVGRVRSAARVRNRVVHGLWATCEEFPDDLLLVTTTDGMYRYRVQDLNEVSQLLMGLHEDLNGTFAALYARIQGDHQLRQNRERLATLLGPEQEPPEPGRK